jgi:hypothetical protein
MGLIQRVKVTIRLVCIRDPLPVGEGGEVIKGRGQVVVVDGIGEAAERVGIKADDHRPEAVRAQSENERPDDWHRSMKEAVSA